MRVLIKLVCSIILIFKYSSCEEYDEFDYDYSDDYKDSTDKSCKDIFINGERVSIGKDCTSKIDAHGSIQNNELREFIWNR